MSAKKKAPLKRKVIPKKKAPPKINPSNEDLEFKGERQQAHLASVVNGARHMSQLPDLLTVQEAAAYLNVPVYWIYERTRTREIPVVKLGRHVRIPRNEFLLYVERQKAIKAA